MSEQAEGGAWSVERVCLVIVAVVAVAVALYWLRVVMVPFVLGLFVTLAVLPVVEWQERRFRLPRVLSVMTTFFAASIGLAVVGGLVSSSVGGLVGRIDVYQDELEALLEAALTMLPLEWLGVKVERAAADFSQMLLDTSGMVMAAAAGEILGVVSSGFLVMVFMAFLLVGTAGGDAPGGGGSVFGEVVRRVQRYIRVKGTMSVLTGACVALNFHLFGVDLALVFGVFACLLNFLPAIGSVVAVLLPVPLVVLSPELGVVAKAVVLLVPVGIQMTLGNVIEPLWMGRSLDVHPVVLLMSLIFWSVLWGVPGMFLAVPMTAVVKIVLERSPETRVLAEIVAGRVPPGWTFRS